LVLAGSEPQKNTMIYWADCSAEVSYEWVSKTELKVKYRVIPGFLHSYEMRASDELGQVKVTFVVTE
jgi:hypothetical protein